MAIASDTHTTDIIDDEHLKVRDMIVDVPHAQRGTFKTVGCPLKLLDSPVEIFSSLLLGEHTEEILRELMGYDKDKVEQLRKEGECNLKCETTCPAAGARALIQLLPPSCQPPGNPGQYEFWPG